MTSSPVQLKVLATYSSGVIQDSAAGLLWTTKGPAGVTDRGLFSCTGIGDASVSAQLGALVASTQTSCLNSPLPQPSSIFIEQSVEAFGPFASWINVKTVYGAKGDGIADDTSALQAALDDQRVQNRVIWLPRGVYNISRGLTTQQCLGLTIIGEDPSNTTIRWDGAPDGTMLDINGCTRLQISRLTFDGNSTAESAEHIWWASALGWFYPTFNLLTDQIVKNVKIGCRLGYAGEITIERVHFDHDGVGIRQEDYNSLNIWVRDSLFSDSGIGITNIDGAGAFNLSNSVFLRSGKADMMINNTGPFSIRRSLSVDSHAFFVSTNTGAPVNIVFQNNTIVSPAVTPIQIGSPSPVFLLDNTFYGTSADMSILSGSACCGLTNVLSLGNRANSTTPFSGKIGTIKSIDDVFKRPVTDASPEPPVATYVPSLSSAAVFEVPAGADSSVIQPIVNQAARLQGGGIVHLPAGHFPINSTIVLPKGEPVRMIGDGPFATYLDGSLALKGSIIRSEGLQSIVANLQISQTSDTPPGAEGLQIVVPDTPATHVLLDEVWLEQDNGLVVDGMDQALVEVLSGQLNSQSTLIPESVLIGGPILSNDAYAFGRVNMFQAGTDWFDIRDGAKLLEEDFWHDGNELGSAINLNGGKGSITVSGAAFNTVPSLPTVTLNDFAGSISLSTIGSTSPVEVGQQSGSTALLLAASEIQFEDELVHSANRLERFGEIANVNVTGNRVAATADAGENSSSWIEHMLASLRTEHPRSRLPLGGNVSRIRVGRVVVASTSAGIHIVPDAAQALISSTHYLIKDSEGNLLSNGSSADCISEEPSDRGDEGWALEASGNGGIYIEGAGHMLSIPSTGALRLSDTSDGARSEWLAFAVGNGLYRLTNRGTGDLLTSNGVGYCATAEVASDSADQEWEISATRR